MSSSPTDEPSQSDRPSGAPGPSGSPSGQPPPYAQQPPYGPPTSPHPPHSYPVQQQYPYPQQSYPQQSYPPQPPPYGQPPTPFGQASPYGPPVPYPPGSNTALAPLTQAARLLGWAIAGLGALTFVFAFLPWVTVGNLSVSGVGGDAVGGAKDGVITLVLGLVCVAAGGVRGLSRQRGGLQLAVAIVALVMGIFISLTALIDIGDVSGQPSAGFFVVSVGSGLYLTLAAGLALVAVSIAAIVKRS